MVKLTWFVAVGCLCTSFVAADEPSGALSPASISFEKMDRALDGVQPSRLGDFGALMPIEKGLQVRAGVSSGPQRAMQPAGGLPKMVDGQMESRGLTGSDESGRHNWQPSESDLPVPTRAAGDGSLNRAQGLQRDLGAEPDAGVSVEKQSKVWLF